MNFGQILSHLQDKHSVSSYKLAKELGFSQAAVSKWKNGNVVPDTKNLQKIADYFNVPLSYLLEENEKKEFKEILSSLQNSNSVSNYKLAKDLGTSQSTIANWRDGKSTPNGTKLQAVADYFHVSVSYLLGGEPENAMDNKLPDRLNDKQKKIMQIAEDLSESELDDLQKYVDFLKSQRKK